jgi:hypothetical protein
MARLSDLGLTQEVLCQAIEFALSYYAECTAHDPPSAAGFLLWDKGMRGLRDGLVPSGWKPVTEDNYPTVQHPGGQWAISVSGGNAQTGRADANPSTRTDKGRATAMAIAQNQASFWNYRPELQPPRKLTWLLLIHVDEVNDEVRAELSLPAGMDDDQRVSWWEERIILNSIPYGPSPLRLRGDDDRDGGELDINVTRRLG